MPEFDRAGAEAAADEFLRTPAAHRYMGHANEMYRHLRAALAELDREKARHIPTYAADLELTLEVIAEALGGTPETTALVPRVERLVAERDRLAAESAVLASQVKTLRSNLETCSTFAEAELARLRAALQQIVDYGTAGGPAYHDKYKDDYRTEAEIARHALTPEKS